MDATLSGMSPGEKFSYYAVFVAGATTQAHRAHGRDGHPGPGGYSRLYEPIHTARATAGASCTATGCTSIYRFDDTGLMDWCY